MNNIITGIEDKYQFQRLKNLWKRRPDDVLGRFCSRLELWPDLEDWVGFVSVEKGRAEVCAGATTH